LSSLFGYAQQGQPWVQALINNPYSGGYQGAANQAGSAYGWLSGIDRAGAGALSSSAMGALPFAQQILQTGFDPQNQLYSRTLNQVQQQTGAELAATGVGATPYGAGVAGQNLSNFNIDWQNQQLQRQQAAAQGWGSLVSGIGGEFGEANQLGAASANAALMSGQVPWAAYGAINSAPLQALQMGQGLYNTGIGAAGNYESLVNQNYGNQLQAYQAQLAQNQALWGDIGRLVGQGAGMATGASSDPWASGW
jgi:hypothetical protein